MIESLTNGTPALRCDDAAGFPILILENPNSLPNPQEWFTEHKSVLIRELRKHGAIWFRGFGMHLDNGFSKAAKALISESSSYRGGTSPRTKLGENTYTSTEYPKELEISLHNEMSYSAFPPELIMFACIIEPQDGGQTPIADCRNVLTKIPLHLKTKFMDKNVMYERNMLGINSPFNSWTKAFETIDRSVVENYCNKCDISYEWFVDGSLKTREIRRPVVTHPITNEEVWFNQVNLWHFSNSPLHTSLSLKSRDGLPMNAFFGDGSEILVEDLNIIREIYASEKKLFKWRLGDLLLIDNYLVAHGRMPFNGPRKIVVTMGIIGNDTAEELYYI